VKKIEILDVARFDLLDGYHFYEEQQSGLGSYFLNSLYSDIESLRLYAGIHRKPHGQHHRLLSKRFPYAVYYKVSGKTVFIHAVIDCRRDPAWIQTRLK
jgi:hypothetical protein